MVNTVKSFTEVHCENPNGFAVRVIQVFAYLILNGNHRICAVSSLSVGKLRRTKASLNGSLGKVLINNLFKGRRDEGCNVGAFVVFALLRYVEVR